MKKNQVSVAILATALLTTLTGCYDRVVYAQRPVQMTQACGQSMQTGAMECIQVPMGQANPYSYPAPQQYYHDHGIGMGTVLGAAALGAGAGYLAGRNNNSAAPAYNQPAAMTAQAPVGTQARANPVAPATPANVSTSGFQSQSAATMGTAKPMSIPASGTPVAVAPSAPRPATTSFAPSPAAVKPTVSFSPSVSRAATTSFTPSRSTFSPPASRSSSTSFTSSRRK